MPQSEVSKVLLVLFLVFILLAVISVCGILIRCLDGTESAPLHQGYESSFDLAAEVIPNIVFIFIIKQ